MTAIEPDLSEMFREDDYRFYRVACNVLGQPAVSYWEWCNPTIAEVRRQLKDPRFEEIIYRSYWNR